MLKTKTPPGVMIYFEIYDSSKWLTPEERGLLFSAILAYGRDGVIPSFEGTTAAIWELIKPRIDLDREKYNQKVIDAHYATYCRESRRHGEKPLSRQDWLSSFDIEP